MWPEFNSMLSAAQWGLLGAAAAAIVALYFLKLKRTPLVVPSTYLWRKSVEDLHVNSIWQRLRRNILLLLQLLVLALVALALLRPTWLHGERSGQRLILLLDHSASMSATDVAPSRLEEAKRRALARIEQMDGGDVAMLIAFSDRARIVQPFTSDRKQLRQQLELIGPTNRSTRLREALLLAEGATQAPRDPNLSDDAASSGRLEATIHLYSDGHVEPLDDVALAGLELVFEPIGTPQAANLAVGTFNTRRHEIRDDRVQAFARLDNHGPAAIESDVELWVDGVLRDAERIEIPAAESRGIEFDLGDLGRGVLELRLGGGDVLAVDDRAWATVDAPRRARVLAVGPADNQPLRYALRTPRARALADVTFRTPEYLESDEYLQRAAGIYDLVIYDRCAPSGMPQAHTLFWGAEPPWPIWSVGQPVELPQLLDYDRAHPLLRLVELGDVVIVEARPLEVPPGGTTLIHSHVGPIAGLAARERFEDIVVGFALVDEGRFVSNWPSRPSFPVFVLNLLDYVAQQSGGPLTGQRLAVGQTVSIPGDLPTDRLAVRLPSGRTVTVERSSLGTFDLADTDELGVYEYDGGGEPQRFAVNLFDAQESAVALDDAPSIAIGYEKIAGRVGPDFARREGWRLLVGAALAALLLEWYIYNRRVSL